MDILIHAGKIFDQKKRIVNGLHGTEKDRIPSVLTANIFNERKRKKRQTNRLKFCGCFGQASATYIFLRVISATLIRFIYANDAKKYVAVKIFLRNTLPHCITVTQ